MKTLCAGSVLVLGFLMASRLSSAAPPPKNVLKDPNHFPIAVWLQSPENAKRYQAAGINLYVGLWQGPTDAQLAALKTSGMPVICEQNTVGLAHKADATIVGWMHQDEPDNAQPMTDPATGKPTYGSCVPPARIVSDYHRLKAADPTRPVMLNLSQGVANDEWIGRGPGAKLDDYKTYVLGGDIVSFDVYPVSGLNKPHSEDDLWYVAKGVSRLQQWTSGKKRVWSCIESSQIDREGAKPTPSQMRTEVWMALIHGATGLIYFTHQFKPTFDEHAMLDDPATLAGVTAIDSQIHDLASVLNSPTVVNGATVASSDATVPIDLMVKRRQGETYVFAVGMRNSAARGSFILHNIPKTATADVLGEGRQVVVKNGRFEDDFKPFDVHLYRITPGGAAKRRQPL